MSITCNGIAFNELIKMFELFQKYFNNSDKHFDEFYLNNTLITHLPSNVFKDSTFEEISIENNEKLKTIDKNAFNSSNSYIKRVFIKNNPVLSEGLDNSLFKALSELKNMEEIWFWNNNITEIPENAFNGTKMDHKFNYHAFG